MSRRQPFFCDRFSREEYVVVSQLRRGFRRGEHHRFPHYEPVLLNPAAVSGGNTDLNRPHDTSGEDHGHPAMNESQALWAFAKHIYARSLTDTLKRFSRLACFSWQDGYPNFRFLSPAPDFAAAGEFLIERAAKLCDTVFQTKPGPFDWSALADLFHRPTPHQLELLNYWDALPPATPRDLEMIRRVSHLDLDGALALVASGANINAFDRCGKTALTTLTRATRWDHIPMDKDYDRKVKALPPLAQDERIRMISRLLDAGGRINLVFYEQCDALTEAVLAGEPETVRFLLSEGADPHYNPWPEDAPEVLSQALRYAESDWARDRGGDRAEEIRRALKDAGAVALVGE
jgi:hypothetical protein